MASTTNSNHIENVAIVGVSGSVGKYMVKELLKTGKHHVTAVTRHDSTSPIPEGVAVKKISYDDHLSMVKALQDQQFLIVTMSPLAPKDQQSKLFKAAADAKVPFIMPNEYGPNYDKDDIMQVVPLGPSVVGKRKEIEQLGVSSWVGLQCGYWYEFSLAQGPTAYGFDIHSRKLVLFDNGDVKINTSTWDQCGRAVARLLSLRIEPESADDKSPCLAQFRNKALRISSYLVSQKDMLESAKRVTGTSDADWSITSESSEQRVAQGREQMMSGSRDGFRKVIYSRMFYAGAPGNYESSEGLHNEVLGLPKENIDESTEIAFSKGDELLGSYKT